MSFKGFRTLSKRFFWNGGTILQFTPEGVRPGIMSSKYSSKYFVYITIVLVISALAMQIDKHSVGYLSYHGGVRSLFSTQLIRDTGKINFLL